MKSMKIEPAPEFHVLSRTKKSEAATMVIAPGSSEGGPHNKHEADQWM